MLYPAINFAPALATFIAVRWIRPLQGHFRQPYNWPLIFLLLLVGAYVAWWKRNIYIAMLLHCSAKTIGAALAVISFLSG